MAGIEAMKQPEIASSPVPVVQVRTRTIPEIRIYSRSTIYYWWPVWMLGFVMATLTYLEGSRAAIVPAGATYDEGRNAIVLPEGTRLRETPAAEVGERASDNKNLGVIFTVALILVVFITNSTVRGVWSAVVILVILLFAVTFAWMGVWGTILREMGKLEIHINMGFYVFFSSILFAVWAAVVFGFDRMQYWKFRPGQMTLESVFGGGQKSYDTSGIAFEKLRDDAFRHWLLGLGTGDLLIKTTGAQQEQIRIPNVLFLDLKLPRLQKLIAERPD